MTAFLFALVPVGAGIASALQAATNGALTLRTSLVTALVVNVAGTLIGAALLLLVPGSRFAVPAAGTPWHLYAGGIYGLVIIAGLAFAFPRLGGAWSIAIPPGLAGASLMLQPAAIHPAVQNGVFALGDGHEARF